MNNIAIIAITQISTENVTSNVFIDNRAKYQVYVNSACGPGLDLSLGSSHCIQCVENSHQTLILIVIVITAFIAGIALVIVMLALNMTVAVGTLNGILFYANIVAANANTYFLPFKSPDFFTCSYHDLILILALMSALEAWYSLSFFVMKFIRLCCS